MWSSKALPVYSIHALCHLRCLNKMHWITILVYSRLWLIKFYITYASSTTLRTSEHLFQCSSVPPHHSTCLLCICFLSYIFPKARSRNVLDFIWFVTLSPTDHLHLFLITRSFFLPHANQRLKYCIMLQASSLLSL